jgi:heme oxygenase
MSADTAAAMSFSARIREASWSRHQELDPSTADDREPGLFDRLFDGSLSLADYTRWHAQQFFIYEAIETAGDRLADDPVAGPFVFPELTRLEAIEADLKFLMGPKWRSGAAPLPATRAYVDRITEAAAEPAGYVAHAYTRYLGDLSGGQAFGKAARSNYGFDGEGASFYEFNGIENLKAFKDEYRSRLDAIDLDEDAKSRLIAEILTAYDHNGAVLAELGAIIGRNPFEPKVIAAICHHMNHDHAADTLGRRRRGRGRDPHRLGPAAHRARRGPPRDRADLHRIEGAARILKRCWNFRPVPVEIVQIVATRRTVTNLARPAPAALP